MKLLAVYAVVTFTLLPLEAIAEPIKLKFAFFSSDRTLLYRAAVKPFAHAVNAEGRDIIEIEVHFSGALGKDPAQQAQLVLNGTADIAFVIPGYTPDRFQDNTIMELPGLFRDTRQATLIFTRLIAAGLLKGYSEYMVIGAFATEPETIHMRLPVASLGDLKGKKIRVNNMMQAAALERLGMSPVLMPVNKVNDAIIGSAIDGAAVPASPLVEFGIGRFVTNHYFLPLGVAPLVVLMNRRKFDDLPDQAKSIISKYSAEWAAERFIEINAADNNQLMDQLKSDPKRRAIFPSQADLDTAQMDFKAVIDQWRAQSARNRELLTAVKAEIGKIPAAP
jgi:TRAP-type C4-dicarboxylate transport system substrate-binding protein